MSKRHFTEDNNGSGFAVEGGGDIDSLLSFATSNVEDDEGDTSHFFSDLNPTSNSTPTPKDIVENSKPQKKDNYEETEEDNSSDISFDLEEEDEEDQEPIQITIAEFDEEDEEEDENYDSSYSENNETPKSRWDTTDEEYGKGYTNNSSEEETQYYEEEPAYSNPTPVNSSPRVVRPPVQEENYYEPEPVVNQPKRFNIPSETDQIDFAMRVISVIDTFRALKSDEKAVVEQIITNDDKTTGDESRIAIKAINADPMLSITMKNFREAKESEAVERAFYVISLPENNLYSLGNMASAFTNEYIEESLDKIEYARKLVDAIAKLDNNAVKYITSTESVLAAASEEKNK